VEIRATDRALKIGQTSQVQVHKFICAGTHWRSGIDENDRAARRKGGGAACERGVRASLRELSKRRTLRDMFERQDAGRGEEPLNMARGSSYAFLSALAAVAVEAAASRRKIASSRMAGKTWWGRALDRGVSGWLQIGRRLQRRDRICARGTGSFDSSSRRGCARARVARVAAAERMKWRSGW